ncbi:MAG TPA: PP2C family serine/threonine-protein phosphatase [Pyrinomonadaceae bacterium]|nr:PP2C family serine/threonine-protein phosphatase [Pyrinomonadaceae bacterium]
MADVKGDVPAQPLDASPDAKPAESNAAASNQDPPDGSELPVAVAATPSNHDFADDTLISARAEAEWRVIGETVPGASHLRAGIPNQDAILHLRQSSARLPVVVSISDGHGSNKCFRSDRGSRFAVRIGADLLDELIYGRHAALPLAEIENRVRDGLTAEFIKRWRAAVTTDLKREPFREEEFARMVEKDGANARLLVEANPHLAYGATSLSFLLTPAYALYLQLGDGEIITVSEQGEIGHPLPDDARLLANETTSLCLDKAAADFRVAVRPHGTDNLPALILMTTDGYYNSFSTAAGFYQVGSDLLQMLREEDGFGMVNRSIKGWLEEATAAGSGDDCTLAIICRMDALKAIRSPNDADTTAVPPITPSNAAPHTTSPQVAVTTSTQPTASHEQSTAPKTG